MNLENIDLLSQKVEKVLETLRRVKTEKSQLQAELRQVKEQAAEEREQAAAEQAKAAAEQTRAQLPTLQTRIEQTRHALAVLTGQPPAALATVLATVRPVPQAASDLALSIPAET